LYAASRDIAYAFYKNVIALRPEWAEIRIAEEGAVLSDKDKGKSNQWNGLN
jgi:type I restriction enzyme R subunit